jgi:hypothetical protein
MNNNTKKSNSVDFHIYPKGPADSMGQEEIVLVRTDFGNIENKYVGDLIQGDYYTPRIPAPFPPRNGDDILKFIAAHKLSFNYVKDENGSTLLVEVMKDGLIQSQVSHGDESTCIREAIEPLMDWEEL